LLGDLLARRQARLFFMDIVREDMSVAEAMGLKVPPFGGKLDYYKFIRGNTFLSQLRRHAILFFVGFRYRKLKSSSLISLQRGGKTEVDFLNGWISGKGGEYGIPTPVNDRIIKIIKEIEAGQRKIDAGNVAEILIRKGSSHG
jgi:2-dehydropantoate 2-reductase